MKGRMEAKLSKETVLKLSKEQKFGDERYEVEFIVDSDFGTPGAVTVVNGYDNELFLENITIAQNLHFASKSWLQPNHKRIFFLDKVKQFSFSHNYFKLHIFFF